MNGTQIELIEQIYYDLISDEGASDSGNVILTFYYKCFEVKQLHSSGYKPLPLFHLSTLPLFKHAFDLCYTTPLDFSTSRLLDFSTPLC